MTHSLNTDQRAVPLAFEDEGNGALVAHVPGDAGALPPGWYMLFALDGGVPSEASMVRLVPR
jgi:galactose oxidase